MSVRRLIACIVALVVSSLPTLGQKATPAPGRGEEWLSLELGARRLVIIAYKAGYSDGKVNACLFADQNFEVGKPSRNPEDMVISRCKAGTKSYSEQPEFYVDLLTGFYEKYPEYKNIPYIYLMARLYDGGVKKPEELYHLAKTGGLRTNF